MKADTLESGIHIALLLKVKEILSLIVTDLTRERLANVPYVVILYLFMK